MIIGIVIFLISFIFAFCLGSIIEWFVHKDLMHSIQWMKTPHLRHAVEHHAERMAPGKYYAKADELKEYHMFETSFMPALWILHAPLFFAAYYHFGLASGIGVAMGTAAYVIGYEVLHWYMHCPDEFYFRNSRWFQYLSEHHRLHHSKASINYNVVFPLADILLGTYYTELDIRREPEDVWNNAPLPPQQSKR
jgi:hypothetical protein